MAMPKKLPERAGTSRTDVCRLVLVECESAATRLPLSKVIGQLGKNCARVAGSAAPDDQVLRFPAIMYTCPARMGTP